ncbi:hypothetical protein OUZ56_011167 [Daphnia magna]|uniref:Centrosomal protein of 97 kDa n=2 Tax=Daphnia magna TaxID=35525 RepID=A0ABQ9YZG0_9CRUS|nr:hypothetical protein OUZ56_011167 [Daphnia magna]
MASAVDSPEVLNLTRQHLKKVEPAPGNLHYSSLLLDHNDIARLENVETYCSLIKFSASHNQLVRMYGVARLYSLRVLNLSHNSIVSIEGLKDMKYLSHLNLAGNNIKSIEHLNANLLLEHLDLSDNAITTIPDLSSMKLLRRLHLQSNRIKTLQFCDKFLPTSLTTLTLAENCLTDVNEVSRLAHLVYLEVFSMAGNPCCSSGDVYRPFLLNWLPGLKILDETLVSAKESLVAEWLFSLGRGRQFKIGQHDELMAYLISIRPEIGGLTNGSQSDLEGSSGKLDKILNLARQNHCDLQLAVSATSSPTPTRRSVPSPAVKKTVPLRKQTSPPKDNTSAKANRAAKSTYEDDLSLEPMPALMYTSLDPSSTNLALERSCSVTLMPGNRPARPVSAQHFGTEDEEGLELAGQPSLRRAASASQQTRKPVYNRSTSHQPRNTKPVSKLPTRKSMAERSGPMSVPSHVTSAPKLSEAQAAVAIQKVWRGYQTRNLNPVVVRLKDHVRLSRTEEHVQHLHRQLAHASSVNGPAVKSVAQSDEFVHLRESHDRLQRQVDDLRQSLQQVLDWMNSSAQQPVPRPRTLPLTSKSAPCVQQPVEHFAQGMADRLIQAVSEPVSRLEPPSSSTVVGLLP